MKKRLFSLVLILCMILTMLPAPAYADDDVKCEIRSFDNEVIYTITGVYKCPSNHSWAKVVSIQSQGYDNGYPCLEDLANKSVTVKCNTEVYCNCIKRNASTGYKEITFTDSEACHRKFHATQTLSVYGGTLELTLDGYFFGKTEEHQEVPATCTSTGTKAYWQCVKGSYSNSPESCGKKFLDADCTQEVTSDADLVIPMEEHSLVYHAAVPKTCTDDGMEEYWQCSVCHQYFSDSGGTNKINAPVTIKAGHTIVSVSKKTPNCADSGYEAHYKCTGCGLYFLDKDGKTEVDWDDLVLPVDKNVHINLPITYGHNDEKHWQVCSNCGVKLFNPIIPEAEHSGSTCLCGFNAVYSVHGNMFEGVTPTYNYYESFENAYNAVEKNNNSSVLTVLRTDPNLREYTFDFENILGAKVVINEGVVIDSITDNCSGTCSLTNNGTVKVLNGGSKLKLNVGTGVYNKIDNGNNPVSNLLAAGAAYYNAGDNSLLDNANVSSVTDVKVGDLPFSVTEAKADKTTITYGDTVTFTATGTVGIEGTPTYSWYEGTDLLGTGTTFSTTALTAKSGQKTHIISCVMKMTVNGVERTASKSVVVYVKPKQISVSEVNVNDKEFDGTTAAKVNSLTFEGLVNNDTFVSGTDYTATASFADASVGNNKDVTVTIKLKNENYTFAGNKTNTTAECKANIIDPKIYPVINVDSINTEYTGSEIPASSIKGTATANGDNIEGTWSWKDGKAPKNVADSTSDTKNWTVVFTPNDSDTYGSVEKNITVTITPKNITINNVTAVPRAYKVNNTTVDLTGGTLAGVVEGDKNNIGFNLGNGTVQTADAGNNKPVSNINIILTGDVAFNYTLTQPTGITVDIIPKVVTAQVAVTGTYTYTGKEIIPTVTVNDGDNVISAEEYTLSGTNNINASTEQAKAVVTVNDKPNGNYTVSGSAEFWIEPLSISGGIVVLGENPTYDGNPKTQTVVSVTTKNNIAVDTYSIVSGNTGTNADEYTLTVKGTGNFKDTASQTWKILKADSSISTAPAAKTDCVYNNGNAMELITAGETDNGTLYYRLGTNGVWTTSAADIKAADAGNYKVYYYVKGNNNYKDIGSENEPAGYVDIEIAKAEPNITKLPSAYPSLTYTGSSQRIISPGETDDGKFMYRLGTDGEWTEASSGITVTDASTYKVYYYVKGDNNHEDSDVDSFDVIMNRQPIEISEVTLKEKTYNGNTDAEIDKITFIDTTVSSSFTFDNPDDMYNAEAKFTDVNAGTDKEAVTTVTLKNPNYILRSGGSDVTTATYKGYYTIKKAAQNLKFVGGQTENAVYGDTDKKVVFEDTVYGDVSYDVVYFTGVKPAEIDAYGNVTFKVAGSVRISVFVSGDKNHMPFNGYKIYNVAKAPVTVTATDKKAYIGDTAPDFTNPVEGTDYNIGGLFGDDQLDGVFTVNLTCNADMNTAGEYDIVPDVQVTTEPTNYYFETKNGKLTVSKWGGGGGGYSEPVYDVTVTDSNSNGTVDVSPKSASEGDTVTITVTPDKGYTLETVTVTDKNGNELDITDLGNGKYSFEMPAGNVTIETSFMEDNAIINAFVDVFPENYFYDAVQWAVKNGITTGVDDLHFDPNGDCTRAQMVTFLWRAVGEPKVDYTVDFTDVTPDLYYADAVCWAASLGIVKGYSNDIFGGNYLVTREQTAAILFRFAESCGIDVSVGENTNILSYTDALKISEYAVPAIQWAVGSGIMQGADGKLMPADSCTRAQIVTLLYRLLG